MAEVSISPKYQVVIPKEIREAMHWLPGQKVTLIAMGDMVYMVPSRPLKELRGMIKLPPGWMQELRDKKDRFP